MYIIDNGSVYFNVSVSEDVPTSHGLAVCAKQACVPNNHTLWYINTSVF